MKMRILTIALLTLGLNACASTWDGMQNDASRNANQVESQLDKAGHSIERQWDKTKAGTQKRLNSTGDAIKDGWNKLTN